MVKNRIWHCISLFFRLQIGAIQQVYGAWRVSGLPQPVVTIFGGTAFEQSHSYAKQAHELAGMFAAAGMSVLTGGGAGIMEAVMCGMGEKGRTIGIGVTGLDDKPNQCGQEFIRLNYLYTRKWLMTRYAVGFVVFPGGYGTLDELSELLSLTSIGKLKQTPIVLIGTEFWDSFYKWLTDEALDHGLVTQEQLAYFRITDDLNEALCMIRDTCKSSPDTPDASDTMN